MATSPEMSVLYEVGAKLPIPLEKRAYFHARLRNRIYSFVLRKFIEKEKEEGLTKAELGRRIGRRPEIISRLLGAPGNWTLETISDLLLGIAGEELDATASPLIGRQQRNMDASDLLSHVRDKRSQENGQREQIVFPIDPGLQRSRPDLQVRDASSINPISKRLAEPTNDNSHPFFGRAA